MVEIFTVGGGDYLVNVLQAVAAWTGNGGYKSLLQVVMVMGLALSAISLAFNQDWRAWINWFLGATLIYSCLMVPRLDVHVTDRLNPSLAPANVGNVPLGLALMASFTSQIGDYLTGSAEVVFGLPGDLNYSRNGMIYGARLYDATRSLRISDPEFASNLDEHFRQCVFYDVLLGRYSMKELAESNDIWTTIAPGSQARAQRFLNRDATSGEVTSTIITCREAFAALDGQWGSLVDAMGTLFGRQLYPNQTEAVAKAKLLADLPIAYQYLTGVSANATQLLKQTLTINAIQSAMHSMSGASGTGSVDVYAGGKLRDALEGHGDWTLEIIKRSDTAKGFVLLPRRWVVERTFAWLGRCRRLAKDWERSIASSTAWANIASIRMLTRRIASLSTH